MSNKQTVITSFSVILAIVCFIWATMMTIMAEDIDKNCTCDCELIGK